MCSMQGTNSYASSDVHTAVSDRSTHQHIVLFARSQLDPITPAGPMSARSSTPGTANLKIPAMPLAGVTPPSGLVAW